MKQEKDPAEKIAETKVQKTLRTWEGTIEI
jgi:hypothetical protein